MKAEFAFPPSCAGPEKLKPEQPPMPPPISDLTSALIGKEFKRSKPMVWEFHGYGLQLAVTDFPWKAIRQEVRKGKKEWELYNLRDDPNETTNLADKNPDVLKRLAHISKTDRTPSERLPLPLYDGPQKK
jgi:arylsulfatase A-like enzyme